MGGSVDLLQILIPYVIIELGLRIFALINVLNAEKKGIKLRWGKGVWIAIVLFVNFGWLVYFIVGKEE